MCENVESTKNKNPNMSLGTSGKNFKYRKEIRIARKELIRIKYP